MSPSELKVYPLNQLVHHGKQSGDSCIEQVRDGRVLRWDAPDVLCFALTAVQDRRNRQYIGRPERKSEYLKMLYKGIWALDIPIMRSAVKLYPDLIPQADEIEKLPDALFHEAATYMIAAYIEN